MQVYNLNEIKQAIRLIDNFNRCNLSEVRIVNDEGKNAMDYITMDDLIEFEETRLLPIYFIKHKFCC